MENNIIKVVAGLIKKNRKLLICQRNKNQDYEFKWEFPGGKIEKKETPPDALTRELKEELDIDVKSISYFDDYQFTYANSDKRLHLFFFEINEFHGKITNKLHNKLNWVEVIHLSEYDFLGGDKKVIKKLMNNNF
jgi:8-oxo-dGTP diphosphatase